LFGQFGYLKNDAKVLALFVLCIAYFIQKYFIGNCPIEQFPSILGVDFIMWHLFQTVFAAGWDCFKVLPQPDSPSLVEAIRTLYGPNLPQKPSSDIKMSVDQPAVKGAPFTTVTNKKHKGKDKVPSSTNPPAPSQNMPTSASVVSRAPPPLPPAKTATTKPTPAKVATKWACLATPSEVSSLYKSDFSIGPVLFLLPLMAFDSGTSLELLPRHRSLFWQPCNARLLSRF